MLKALDLYQVETIQEGAYTTYMRRIDWNAQEGGPNREPGGLNKMIYFYIKGYE